MTDEQYERLTTRVLNGKKWIEQIKANKTYNSRDNAPHLQFWFEISDLLLKERLLREKINILDEKHSQAWEDLKARELSDEHRKEEARIKARERAARKRGELI